MNRAQKNRRAAYTRYINSPEWKMFRLSIFAERGRRCQKCGTDRGEIHIHHLTYVNFTHEQPADVQVLCKPCHDLHHGGRPARARMREFLGWFEGSLAREAHEWKQQPTVRGEFDTVKGEVCQKCGKPTKKKTHDAPKRGKIAYYAWWFRCKQCKWQYMPPEAKRTVALRA